MKAVVLTLALLFLTGSQAQHETQQEESPSQWERVKALAQVYLNSARVTGREYIVKFEDTDLAKKLNLTVLGKLDTLSSKVATKVADLQNQFGPLTQSFWAKMTNEVGVLTRELNKDLTEVMKPRLENIQKKWQEKMGPLGQDLLDRVQKQLQGLQEKLGQLGGKVLDRARQQVERARVHMNSLPVILTPLGAELRQCMEPYSEHLRDQLQTLREAGVGLPELREQLLSLHEQAEPTLKEMHEDLKPLWEIVQNTFLPFVHIDIGDISQGLTAQ